MATEKQIAANRRNAQKSTGPRTEEGKSKTRLNALRDGFTGQVITLSAEDLPVFEKFKSDLIKDLAPKTTMEPSLADAIAWDTWRLNHLRAVEMNMYALGSSDAETVIDIAMSAAATFAKEANKFALMSIYEQRMNRSLHKNLATSATFRPNASATTSATRPKKSSSPDIAISRVYPTRLRPRRP